MIQPRAEGSDNLIHARTTPEVEGIGSLPALLVHHEFHAAGEVGRKQAQGERHLAAGWDAFVAGCWLDAFWRPELRGRSQKTINCKRDSLYAAIWPRSGAICENAKASVQ